MRRRKVKSLACGQCGRRYSPRDPDGGLCPACAQGIRITPADELIAEREEQLKRASEMAPGKVRDAYIHEIMTDIERIQRTESRRRENE